MAAGGRAEATPAVRPYTDAEDTGYVLTRPDGTPLPPASLTTAWRTAVRRAQARQEQTAAAAGVRLKPSDVLPPLKLHEARHTANTVARLYARVAGAVLLQRMGHTEDTTNALYTHAHPGLHQAAAEAIAQAYRAHRTGGSQPDRAATGDGPRHLIGRRREQGPAADVGCRPWACPGPGRAPGAAARGPGGVSGGCPP